MDFFDYIATNDPADTAAVIQSFGYKIQNQDLGQCARDLVRYEGEPGLEALASIHPDKDLILHYYGNKKIGYRASDGTVPSPTPSIPPPQVKSGNNNEMMLVFLMAATLLITAAIISKDKIIK